MASPNINMRDPVLVPDPPRRASPDRPRVVHLSDVRLRASAVGCDRGRDALAVHARIRGSPAALRLGRRDGRHRASAAAVRVRAAQPELHGDEQAEAAAAGRAKHVAGWDDPRMPTIAGLRRRGYTPESIRDFCQRIGVAKKANVIDIGLLEHCVREDLNRRAPARDERAAPAEGGADQLSRRPGRGDGPRQQPGESVRRHASGALLARALYRGGRLHGGSAEEVLPPRPGTRSAAPQRLSDHLHRGGEGRERRRRRVAVHLRSRHARRRRAGRPQREGHAALGVGAACG